MIDGSSQEEDDEEALVLELTKRARNWKIARVLLAVIVLLWDYVVVITDSRSPDETFLRMAKSIAIVAALYFFGPRIRRGIRRLLG